MVFLGRAVAGDDRVQILDGALGHLESGCLIVVSATGPNRQAGLSSKPMTETSSGT